MTEPSVAQPRASIFWRFYMLTWAGLAGIAVTYLAVAASKPEFVDKLTGQAAIAEAQAERDAKAKVVAQLQTLKDTVIGLKNELQRVEARVKDQDVPEIKAVAVPAPPIVQVPVRQQPIAALPTAQPIEAPATVKPASVVATPGKIPPLPERAPLQKKTATLFKTQDSGVAAVVLNQARDGRIVTGSIPKTPKPVVKTPVAARAITKKTPAKPAPIRFGAPKVTPAAQQFNPSAVVVSAASSLDGLRASWQQLSSKHPALLGTLQPRYDAMGADGPYRLLAGPLSDRVEADRLCSALRIYKVTCGVGEFVGNVL